MTCLDELELFVVTTDEAMVRQGYVGMLVISGFLLFASAVLWKLMDRRWGAAEFSN